MNKESLANFLTRIHFCNNPKLESIDEYISMKNYILTLSDHKFYEKLREFGLYDKETS